jgi:hypothetical protein
VEGTGGGGRGMTGGGGKLDERKREVARYHVRDS